MIKDCCTCIHEYRHPMSDVCRECGIAMLNYKERTPAVTNSDRIRGMTDEELARFIAGQRGWYCDFKDPEEEEYPKVLNWLKSPVEVQDG